MPESDQSRGLAGVEVAITGRLASMSREEAVGRILAAGGVYVDMPRDATDLLAVGQGGPPLGEDGLLTHALRRARELQDAGAPLELLSEEDLLARLGLEEERAGLHRATTTTQLARILGVPPSAIRSWVSQGLIEPVRTHGRLFFFSFLQVASAKSLCELLRAGATPARLRRSLELLRGRVPDAERMLGQLEVLSYSGPLFVRTSNGALAEPNGQLCFEFDAGGEPEPRPWARGERTLAEWVDLGLRAEHDGRVEEAVRAYRSALARDQAHPEVHFNLGNALYALGSFQEALERYRRAVELAPDYVEAWNNLGILLGELDRPDEAVRAYRRALSLAPDYPDALYNLAETLVARGELDEARRLWRTYLRVDPQSPFARIVRERLERLGV